MFRLNEAPNEVLSAISAEKVSRGCGIFWAIACCLPSCGCSIGCCGNCDSPNSFYAGCLPKEVPDDTPVTLSVLTEKLREIKITKAKLSQLSEGDVNFDVRTQIEWQVKTTLKLLSRAVDDGKIQGTYLASCKGR